MEISIVGYICSIFIAFMLGGTIFTLITAGSSQYFFKYLETKRKEEKEMLFARQRHEIELKEMESKELNNLLKSGSGFVNIQENYKSSKK